MSGTLCTIDQLAELVKALEAGNYNAAPVPLDGEAEKIVEALFHEPPPKPQIDVFDGRGSK